MDLAIKAVGSFGVALILFKALALVEMGTHNELIWGLVLVCLVAVILWFTADYWCKWVFAFCAANVLRCAAMGLVGRTMSYPSKQAPRAFFWEMAAIFAVIAIELYPFLHNRTTFVERLSLILVPISLAYSLLSSATILLMLVPVLFLAPFAAYRVLIGPAARSQ